MWLLKISQISVHVFTKHHPHGEMSLRWLRRSLSQLVCVLLKQLSPAWTCHLFLPIRLLIKPGFQVTFKFIFFLLPTSKLTHVFWRSIQELIYRLRNVTHLSSQDNNSSAGHIPVDKWGVTLYLNKKLFKFWVILLGTFFLKHFTSCQRIFPLGHRNLGDNSE